MGYSLGQTAVVQSFPASVKSRAEADSGQTNFDEVSVETENERTSIEDGNIKLAVEVEGDKSVSAENIRTVVGTGNVKACGQVKNDELSVVSMSADSSISVPEHSSVFVKTTFSASPLSTAIITNDCSILSGNTVTPERQTVACDQDVLVGTGWLEPQNKKTDAILPLATLPGPSLSAVTSLHTLPAAAVCHVSASQDVYETNAVACVGSVRVKQEQTSEREVDDDLSVYASLEEGLQESEEMKVEPEVMS
jgi:hypothetical protein